MLKTFAWLPKASWFLILLAGVALGDTRVRVVAANLTSGRYQSYDPGHGSRILQSAHPDVAALQEFNYKDNSPASLEEFVKNTFGKGFSYYRETNPKYRIPNGIVSRYPILESGSWPSPLMPDRGFAWAKIKLPAGQELWAISVHLSTKSATNRKIEAERLLQQINKQVPPGALIAIAGDMNIKGDTEFALDVLSVTVGETRQPVDPFGNRFTNAPRSKLYDRILVSPALDAFHVPVELDLGTNDPDPAKNKAVFPNGLVYDTRVMKQLPPPALADDSGAENMQHMMIVQDYSVPDPKAQPSPGPVPPDAEK